MSKERPPYSNLNKGTFMIASPEVDSGVFFRSVVILCEHSAAGSFGLIVNKPLQIDLPEEIASIGEIQNQKVQFRTGGPMQPSQMMLLHNSDGVPGQTLELCPGLFLGGDLQFLQQALTDPAGPSVHLCFGYSGWTAGFLEREFLNGNWFLKPATADHIFSTPPEKLWQTLLREMGGKYASLSMIPEDLSLN